MEIGKAEELQLHWRDLIQEAATLRKDFNKRQHKSISDQELVQLTWATGSEISL